ncbi:MAG: 16S rRNA (uracil(1498)-N(3))-methyltransferase [Thermoguttaceae bacterium]|nr:16S rRNA (uracil(1498)-N(3))-methyltransferase [Thermoguttaceae bacterium]
MADRYFVAHPIGIGRVTLDGPEGHHLAHVMRAKPGMEVILFDGSGAEFLAQVLSVRRSAAELEILTRREVDRESPVALTLGVSLPKGDRQKWLVEKVVELGLRRLVPLVTSRSVAQTGADAVKRLDRAVIEASKQCGRNRLMTVDTPQSWPDFIAATCGAPCRVLAHPGVSGPRASLPSAAPEQVVAAVGPEGGFTDEEVEEAVAAGWQTVSLGPRILRVETAAVVLAAWAATNYRVTP